MNVVKLIENLQCSAVDVRTVCISTPENSSDQWACKIELRRHPVKFGVHPWEIEASPSPSATKFQFKFKFQISSSWEIFRFFDFSIFQKT